MCIDKVLIISQPAKRASISDPTNDGAGPGKVHRGGGDEHRTLPPGTLELIVAWLLHELAFRRIPTRKLIYAKIPYNPVCLLLTTTEK